MKMYVYDADCRVVAVIKAATAKECAVVAGDNGYNEDRYFWSYTDAGLRDEDKAPMYIKD